MANGNDPANIAYVIVEDGFYYVAYKEKVKVPEVVVSAKGVANGLSEEYNDGWDFGPDSYDPTSTANPPYTQTAGIQEAYNSLPLQYVPELSINVPVGKIVLLNGVYNCTNTILINPMSIVEFIGENAGTTVFAGGDPSTQTGVYIKSTGQYGALSVTTTSPTQFIGRIKLENLYIQYTLPSGQTSIDGNPDNQGYSIINTQSFNENIMIDIRVGTQSLINNQSVISAGNGIDNLLYLDRVFTHAPSSMTHLASYSNHLHVGFIAMYADPDNGPVNGFTSTTNNGIMQIAVGMNLFMEQIHIFGTVYNILYVEAENANNSSPTRLSSLLINSIYLEIGTPTQTTDYYAFSIYKNVIIVNYQESTEASTYSPLIDASNNFVLPMKILSTNNSASVPAPTISTNPPVSATVYQNTNPYDIEIDLPVYATTSGTAGYVTVAKGSSSSSLTTIGNQYVSGDTSDTSEQIIRLRVPANWYYEFTASGVTFGTASVFAD